MQIISFPAPIFISKFRQHDYFKQSLLDLIDQQESQRTEFGNVDYGESLYKTDWHLSVKNNFQERKSYFDLIYNDIFFHIKQIFDKLDGKADKP
jgi:hypothetical protein